MSAEQIKELLEESSAAQPVEVILSGPEDCAEPAQPAKDMPALVDVQASEILSAPPPVVPDAPNGVSNVLKTRKQLITKIQEVCDSRGVDHKPLNLKRRRKNSLQGILQTQFAEAVKQETEPQIHEDLKPILPEGMEARTKFAVDMAFRLDLTICKVLERGIEATDGYHGLTADGFARSIETNETLTGEIRDAWLEILQEPDNEWIMDSCTAVMRLTLAHVYGLLNVVRSKRKRSFNVTRRPIPEVRVPIPKEAVSPVATRKPTGKLRDLALQRQKSREDHITEILKHQGAGGLAKSV